MDDARANDVDDALARAIVYHTLSVGFQPPTGAGVDTIEEGEGFGAVIAALGHLARRTPDASLESVAARLASARPPAAEALAGTFVRLFGHTARGLVCPYEIEYGPDNGFHQPQQMADLSGYYLAFGLRPRAPSDLRLDHIACECEFMDFLNRKAAVLLAGESGELDVEETLDVTERAARAFLRDHLARFGCAFGTRLASEDPDGYFGVLGHLLLVWLTRECARLGVAAGPTELGVRPDTADEAPMACGTADDLIQIRRRS